jgi:hypothetical protein
MTHSPQTGQTAPPESTDFEQDNGSRPGEGPDAQFTSTPLHGSGWSTPTPTLPAFADAPTASVPTVTEDRPPAAPPDGPSAKTSEGAPSSRQSRVVRSRGPRRARLQLRHINPWTVLKFSCVLSIALFFVWLIVVGVLFGILDAAGVVGKVNDTVTTINGSGSKAPVNAGIVFGGAAIIGVINIVLFIALTTIGSVVYNLCADLVGGIELTLSES